jgi:hypothetical protein
MRQHNTALHRTVLVCALMNAAFRLLTARRGVTTAGELNRYTH